MSWIKIEEARLNFNEQKTKENTEAGRPETEGHLSQSDITKLLHPEYTGQSWPTYRKRLFEGGPNEKKMVNVETVKEICRLLNTTPNFLFGFED